MKCLKKRDLTIWKLVRQFLHVSQDNLPLILYIVFCVQAFVIYKTDFYSNYYVWFDYIDTALYVVITYDILNQIYNNVVKEKLFRYNEINGICSLILFALLLINFCFYQFGMTDYINIYKSILIGGAIAIILTYIKE